MNVDYTAYNKAHTQPFDVNVQPSTEDDWRLYNAAHADPAAVPIESIQASPANIVEATAAAHTADTLPEPTSSAHASVRLANEPQPKDPPTVTALAQYEAIAPGLALAILEAEQSHSKQRRQYRMARLAVTTLIAVTAIACGQWALVNGADQQALILESLSERDSDRSYSRLLLPAQKNDLPDRKVVCLFMLQYGGEQAH